MKILLVAATKLEIEPFIKQLKTKFCSTEAELNFVYKDVSTDILITGIGLVFTCYQLTKVLNDKKYDLIVNLGIAGSFNRNLNIGEVVHVTEEEFCDLGIESQTDFKTLFEMGFADKNMLPFQNAKLNCNYLNFNQLNNLKKVKSISSNTAHGNEKNINEIAAKFNPDIESMEGAAFFYVCLMEKVNFIEIRAISNYVEARDTSKWNIPLALKNLSEHLIKLLDDLGAKI